MLLLFTIRSALIEENCDKKTFHPLCLFVFPFLFLLIQIQCNPFYTYPKCLCVSFLFSFSSFWLGIIKRQFAVISNKSNDQNQSPSLNHDTVISVDIQQSLSLFQSETLEHHLTRTQSISFVSCQVLRRHSLDLLEKPVPV